jgi:hypothetical protein
VSWPYPGDGPLARARRVAHAYRARLAEIDPQGCAELDDAMRRWGQGWAVPRVVTYDPDAMLTPAEAAELAACDPATLRQHRLRGRLTGEPHGRTWRYRAADIIALSAKPRNRERNT